MVLARRKYHRIRQPIQFAVAPRRWGVTALQACARSGPAFCAGKHSCCVISVTLPGSEGRGAELGAFRRQLNARLLGVHVQDGGSEIAEANTWCRRRRGPTEVRPGGHLYRRPGRREGEREDCTYGRRVWAPRVGVEASRAVGYGAARFVHLGSVGRVRFGRVRFGRVRSGRGGRPLRAAGFGRWMYKGRAATRLIDEDCTSTCPNRRFTLQTSRPN
jgi:hypothetical protein